MVYAVILYLKLRDPKSKASAKEYLEDQMKKIMISEEDNYRVCSNGASDNHANQEEESAVLLARHTGQSAVSILCKNRLDQTQLRHSQGRHNGLPSNSEKTHTDTLGTEKNYTTWNYQYAKVDRFFLFFSPFLFLIFNTIYWGYFIVWDKLFKFGRED